MGFNWGMATAGLLGEAGRLADNQAERMTRLEEKKLEQQQFDRREEAILKREISLKALGYDQDVKLEGLKQGNRIKVEEGKAENETVGYREDGSPIRRGTLKPGESVYEKALPREVEKKEDPEFKKGKALKEIATVDEAIGLLRKTENLSKQSIEALSEMDIYFDRPVKEMSDDDRDKAVASLENYRSYLTNFTPQSSGGGILGGNTGKAAGSSGAIGDFISNSIKKPKADTMASSHAVTDTTPVKQSAKEPAEKKKRTGGKERAKAAMKRNKRERVAKARSRIRGLKILVGNGSASKAQEEEYRRLTSFVEKYDKENG